MFFIRTRQLIKGTKSLDKIDLLADRSEGTKGRISWVVFFQTSDVSWSRFVIKLPCFVKKTNNISNL